MFTSHIHDRNTYPKGRALMKIYRVVPQKKKREGIGQMEYMCPVWKEFLRIKGAFNSWYITGVNFTLRKTNRSLFLSNSNI